MLKRSINIEVIYTELPWKERFQAAKKDGFYYIEFWGWENKNLAEIKQLLKKNDLSLSAMSGDGPYSMCDPETKKEYIEYIKKSIKAAKEIGCPTLVIHSNALAENPQWAADFYEQYSDTVKICTMFENLKTIASLAEEAEITFVLEALNTITDHIGNFLTTTQMSAEITQAVGSPNIKILYDAYHMYLNEGKICETLSKYIDVIGYIHIADAPGRGEPGTGVINYRNVFNHLVKIGYEHVIGFELYPKDGTNSAIKSIHMVTNGI